MLLFIDVYDIFGGTKKSENRTELFGSVSLYDLMELGLFVYAYGTISFALFLAPSIQAILGLAEQAGDQKTEEYVQSLRPIFGTKYPYSGC